LAATRCGLDRARFGPHIRAVISGSATMVATTDSTVSVWSWSYLKDQLATALLNPIRAFRPRYLPLLMVYFAYGALGLIAVAESFWVKKALTLSPAR
jgi:hypothetical protein